MTTHSIPEEAPTWTLVGPGVFRARFGEPESLTPMRLHTVAPRLAAMEALPAVAEPPIAIADTTFRRSRRGCRVELPLHRAERLFGLGLQLKSFGQTNRKKVLRTNSDPPGDSGDSHAPVPFYLSSAGYGVLADSARYVSLYGGSHSRLGAEEAAPAEGELADSAEELYRRATVPRGPCILDVPAAAGVDLYLFAGPSMMEALRRYILFSGGGCLPPIRGLGNGYRGYARNGEQEALGLARELRESGMPFDVYGLEPGWQRHAYACDFVWHPQRFPDPATFVREMDALGFQLNLWEHVFTSPGAPFYEDMKPHAGDYRVWGGLVPDLLQPEAQALLEHHHEEHFVRAGVAGFKLDECDNSDFVAYPWSFPEATEFPSGADGEQMHSLYGLQYQRMMAPLFRKYNRRTYGQVRSSHALAAPYPFVLYSDLYDHRDFLRGVCTAPLSGLLWCPEVRQCRNEEDLIRRLQSVVFSAQSLINGWMIRNPPWKQVNKQLNNEDQFMEGWRQTEDRCRTILQWRMRLLPYLYAAFARYHFEGIPPVRPLVLEYPDDPEAHSVDDAWLFGEDLLVAPVVAGESTRKVYLPHGKGHWFDVHTGSCYASGEWHTVECPLDRIPLFVRSGALLPLAEPKPRVENEPVFHLTVHTFGESLRSCELHEDDFQTFAYTEGAFNRVVLEAEPDGQAGLRTRERREGAYAKQAYQIDRWVRADGIGVSGFTC